MNKDYVIFESRMTVGDLEEHAGKTFTKEQIETLADWINDAVAQNVEQFIEEN